MPSTSSHGDGGVDTSRVGNRDDNDMTVTTDIAREDAVRVE